MNRSAGPCPPDEVRRRLGESGVVAILRAASGARLREVVEVLVASGMTAIELTLTTPGALGVLEQLCEQPDDGVMWGAGTVVSVQQAQAAVEAGAKFLVAPTTDADVLAWCGREGVAMVPGALTPTEIAEAWTQGAAAVKVFPCNLVGGVDYIRAVRAPLPDIPLLPTGGIRIEEVSDYLSAGCISVGIGAPLLGDSLQEGGDLEALGDRASRAVAAVRAQAEAAV